MRMMLWDEMQGMNTMQNKQQKPNHEGNIISHLRKRQELELRIWKVVSGALQYSCGFFCLLWLVGVSVLSNLVYAGSFHPKPTQDYKVSICITIMCMRNSCWCTYCLKGLMGMKVFSLIFFALMHMAKIHVTHCLLYHGYALTCFYISYSHDCIHVGGAYDCYMSFQSFSCYSLYPYLKLWCMLSSITKKGEIESKSAP